eukprot:Gb_26740 [translate_table: standard]
MSEGGNGQGENGQRASKNYRGVQLRRWEKWVAEIRCGKRSRISLGSYFTPEAAARAYDTALLSLTGPNSSHFNFPDSADAPLPIGFQSSNPSPNSIRRAAVAVGSAFDTVPPRPPPPLANDISPHTSDEQELESPLPPEVESREGESHAETCREQVSEAEGKGGKEMEGDWMDFIEHLNMPQSPPGLFPQGDPDLGLFAHIPVDDKEDEISFFGLWD